MFTKKDVFFDDDELAISVKYAPRVYWCKKCKNLFNQKTVPVGKAILLPNGDVVYLCKSCAEQQQNNIV